ncbi:MAG: diadenosine tetraphosphate hydrolase [Candidatus Moranbacteria bacterium CG_4_10_14_3_um_filter_45_9]|nr:MAG: diadenosine tetraphosphate hydrolase [Candidatus Moranbacteria bacterium CG_4_10_14_3_um_filter_45_9]PJA85091.1 MAG: diadenosine tetraphosphate hydrolase [Candidatus Moranbacteria bacterium CG_4_9_14_3_um_filter_45_14]
MHVPVIKPLYFFLKWCGFPVIWETSIGTIIFRMKEGMREYLLLHYPSGHFDFVKGHIEANETEEMTLRRETEEESGIKDLQVFPKRVSICYFYVAKGAEREKRRKQGRGIWIFKVVHFYPARTETRDIRISYEHTGFLWLSYEEALAKVTFANAKRILSETEEYLKKSHSENS